MKSMNRQLVGLSALAVLAASFGAMAQQVEQQPELTLVQVVKKLESLGYTAIEDVEKDDGVWEAEATAPNGKRVELEIDPKDGRILKEEPDDDDRAGR
jgi:Peptidase propeptide and YPEB domain